MTPQDADKYLGLKLHKWDYKIQITLYANEKIIGRVLQISKYSTELVVNGGKAYDESIPEEILFLKEEYVEDFNKTQDKSLAIKLNRKNILSYEIIEESDSLLIVKPNQPL